MATTRNVTRSRSLATKPKPKPVSSSEPEAKDGSHRTSMEKPLPNYLKPTFSSRPNNQVNKNKAVEDKLLRRRSLDRPSSSLTSKSTSASSHTIPARPRDKPVVPRESKRGGLRGSSTVKSHPVVSSRGTPSAKTSGLSSSSSSKSKKEGFETVPKKSSGEITGEFSPLAAPAHEDEETDVQVSDHREEQVARPDESIKEIEISPEDASAEEVKEELINEDKTKEEPKEPENTQDNNTKDIDDEENCEIVALESKAGEETKAKDEEGESKEGIAEPKTQLEKLQKEETKKEVVQGKKVCQTVYNDVIASKMQENPKKNKVLALAGAFQTVIDYETAASK